MISRILSNRAMMGHVFPGDPGCLFAALATTGVLSLVLASESPFLDPGCDLEASKAKGPSLLPPIPVVVERRSCTNILQSQE